MIVVIHTFARVLFALVALVRSFIVHTFEAFVLAFMAIHTAIEFMAFVVMRILVAGHSPTLGVANHKADLAFLVFDKEACCIGLAMEVGSNMGLAVLGCSSSIYIFQFLKEFNEI